MLEAKTCTFNLDFLNTQGTDEIVRKSGVRKIEVELYYECKH